MMAVTCRATAVSFPRALDPTVSKRLPADRVGLPLGRRELGERRTRPDHRHEAEDRPIGFAVDPIATLDREHDPARVEARGAVAASVGSDGGPEGELGSADVQGGGDARTPPP